jgi:hypothetical protein
MRLKRAMCPLAFLAAMAVCGFNATAGAAQRGDDEAPDVELGARALAAAPVVPALNAKLLAYAKANIGKKIGDGECTTLVNTGYQAVGARRDPPFGPNVDYIWGTPIRDRTKVLPGDVIQFRDAVFKTQKKSGNTITIYTFRLPHHTAIVSEARNSGAAFVILNQNSSDSTMGAAADLKVKSSFIKMADLQTGGKLWFYRPIAAAK